MIESKVSVLYLAYHNDGMMQFAGGSKDKTPKRMLTRQDLRKGLSYDEVDVGALELDELDELEQLACGTVGAARHW